MTHEIVKYCEESLALIEDDSDLSQRSSLSFFGHKVKGKVANELLSNKNFRHLIKEVLLWHEISSDIDSEINSQDNTLEEKMGELGVEIQDYLNSALH